MENHSIEASYPITFRSNEAKILGNSLKSRDSVVLIGMRRVGISNFLRFFLFHRDIVATYIDTKEKHLFIPVDLNDLVEREIFPFWVLTLKRIVDAIEHSDLNESLKKDVETLFLDSIQSKDLFLLIDGVRKSLIKIIDAGYMPTIFFIRFDRMKDAITPEFYANLQGLKDAMHHKLAYVFTGFRGLEKLSPDVFTKSSLSVFAKDMYIKPVGKDDTKIIFEMYKARYHLVVSPKLEQALFDLVDGYVQYLQLALIFLQEHKGIITTKESLFDLLIKDERISLQSEELWENLAAAEQDVLIKLSQKTKIKDIEKEKAKYLWDMGFVISAGELFSPLFASYVCQKQKNKADSTSIDFSKKEHLLFTMLLQKKNEICEREEIISYVWPEVEALGVSDWAIDRLVARVRNKLKLQQSKYEIQTVKTRGYKLIA